MYLQGRYQWEIGETLGVTQATVSLDLKAIREQWKASAVRDFDEAKERELARIDALEREYWAAWQTSKEQKESTSTEKSSTEGVDRLKAAVKKEDRDGNPAFLVGVQWCITKRCDILGFDAPKKVAPTTPDGKNEYTGNAPDVDEFKKLSLADRLRLLRAPVREAPVDRARTPDAP